MNTQEKAPAPAAVKPTTGLYKTKCPHCQHNMLSGRSIAMRTGSNFGTMQCSKCNKVFAQRLVGDTDAMESCVLETDQAIRWLAESVAEKPPLHPALQPVE